MSSAIMSLLISHILTFIESELAKEEPVLMAALIADIQSLIAKLESMLTIKSPKISSLANPVLSTVSTGAIDALQAAGNVVEARLSNNQSVE